MKLFLKPAEAIEEMKGNEKFGKSFLVLVIAGVLLGITVLIGGQALGSLIPGASLIIGWQGALIALVAIIILGLFSALILKIIMKVLTGKHSYHKSFATIAYPYLIFAIGILIVTLLSLIPVVGSILGALVMVIFMALYLAAYIKMIKVLFETDFIVALIAAIILFVSFYFLLASLVSVLTLMTGGSVLGELGAGTIV